MINLRASSLQGDSFSTDLFGANILANRDQIGPDGTYDDVIHSLHVPHIRYPGGSLTEFLFDISNPNAARATDPSDGQTHDMLPYGEFMGWAESEGIAVSVVIPSRGQMTNSSDANGDRYPDIDEQEVRTFIRDTLNGEYGSPEIRSFEIGNEYWGSGDMSSVEYGRYASEMSLIVKDEIRNHPEFDQKFTEIDVAAQVGYNYGVARLSDDYAHLGNPSDQIAAVKSDYNIGDEHNLAFGNGQPNWTKIANILVEREFDDEETEAVDALVLHTYGQGLDNPNAWYFGFDVTNQVWGEDFGHATRYVTEWNSKTAPYSDVWQEEYGLLNAHEMLQIAETMVINRVESAHVWAVQQNTATDLANDEGTTDLTVSGEIFRMMAESLPGKRRVDLVNSSHRETEVEEEDASVHVFADDDGGMVLFIASTSADGTNTLVDLSPMIADPGNVTIDVLGVEAGDTPTSNRADPEVRRLEEEDFMVGSQITVELAAYEIMRVELEDANFTQAFQRLLAENPDPGNPHDGYALSIPNDEDEDEPGQSGAPTGHGQDAGGDQGREDDAETEDTTCFVATVAYQDPWHPDVKWLRGFRDETLVRWRAGRAFVDFYWRFGPSLARQVRKSPRAAALSKWLIGKIVKILKAFGAVG